MNDVLDAVLQVAALGVMTLGAWAIGRLSDWLKLRADSEVRSYLLAALDRAVEYGQAEARRRLGAVASEAARDGMPALALALARGYAQERVPDALRRLGVEEAGLDAMLVARLPRPPMPGSLIGGVHLTASR